MGEQASDRNRDVDDPGQSSRTSRKRPDQHADPIEGTPLANATPIEPIDFVRTVALARIMMPESVVRLSAGRTAMSDEMQALCFFAGANSIFVGDTLLTAANPENDKDMNLFRRLGLQPMELEGSN